MLGPGRLTPAPSLFAPEILAAVASVLDEPGELGLRDRRTRDREAPDLDRVRPLLVVEDKGPVRLGAEAEDAARDDRIARHADHPGGQRRALRWEERSPRRGDH